VDERRYSRRVRCVSTSRLRRSFLSLRYKNTQTESSHRGFRFRESAVAVVTFEATPHVFALCSVSRVLINGLEIIREQKIYARRAERASTADLVLHVFFSIALKSLLTNHYPWASRPCLHHNAPKSLSNSTIGAWSRRVATNSGVRPS